MPLTICLSCPDKFLSQSMVYNIMLRVVHIHQGRFLKERELWGQNMNRTVTFHRYITNCYDNTV